MFSVKNIVQHIECYSEEGRSCHCYLLVLKASKRVTAI
jgi:hypothetical protein